MQIVIASLVFALAALVASGAAGRRERRDSVAALLGEARDRVLAGERGVRLEASGWGENARLVSAFNAAVEQLEGGGGEVAGAIDRGSLFHNLRAELGLPGSVDVENAFVGVLEIARFAGLRRKVGTSLANALLKHVADSIRDELPNCDIGRIGRTSVDFAFRAPDPDAAASALRALAIRLERRIDIEGYTFDLPIAIGFAQAHRSQLREEILDQAAAAVAKAQTDRSHVCFADHLLEAEQSFEDLTLVRDLARAMAEGELQLYYQPKLRSRTDTIDSAEALLRWFSPTRGQVPTERIVALAEDTGAIRELTEWVVRRAVADQAELAAAGHDLVVYVNISGVVLPDQDFARTLLDIVATAPGRIGFEITETAVIVDPDRALANLRAFAEAGIKIAIDDYGSGLSSLAYLKQLPASELKIDRMFVSGLVESHRDPLLVRSSIDLAHALEMEVTAEGVDDLMVLSLLRVMGCDLIQGFLVSPPLPRDALRALLDDRDHLGHLAARPISVPGQWPAAAAE